MDYRGFACYLIDAEEKQQPVSCITDKVQGFTLSMGYKVQRELVNIKQELGHSISAYKMGLTSHAKMKQMNINEPIYGYIFDYMNVQDKGQIKFEDFIHPKVEAEIAFVLGEDTWGPSVTGEEVLAKTEWILPALEIIDSRYENFKFELPDVVADNTSAARVVFGNRAFRPADFEIDKIGVKLTINGELKASGVSTAVLGNPANSVAMLAKMLYNDGMGKIPKGSIILTGGITEAILLSKGDHVVAQYDGMDETSFRVE